MQKIIRQLIRQKLMKRFSLFSLKAGVHILVAVFFLLAFTPIAHAEYEIDKSSGDFYINVPTDGTIVQWTEDVVVTWAKPTMQSGDVLNGFVYIWNYSATALDDNALSGTTKDGFVHPDVDPPTLTKQAADFANDDSNIIRYLHIKTVYFSTTEGEKLSDDVVIGPINIDNVAPTGTIALDTDVAGQTATTSSVNPVTLKVTSTPDIKTVYFSNTTTKPETGVAYQATLTHEVPEGTGSKTIYAWFEDTVGNLSDFVTLTFEMIAGKSMEPAGDFDLVVGATQTFTILGKGATETFNWVFVDSDPADVASFDGEFNNVASVTIVGDKGGTFKVQATSIFDSAVYTSGTITVAGCAYARGDVNTNGEITVQDAVDAFWLSFNTEWTFDQLCTADYNEDGEVTAGDAVAMFLASF